MVEYIKKINASIKKGSYINEVSYSCNKTGVSKFTTSNGLKERTFTCKIEIINGDKVAVQNYPKENNIEERARVTSLTNKTVVFESKTNLLVHSGDDTLYQFKLHFEKK